jgi:hypothetical protein
MTPTIALRSTPALLAAALALCGCAGAPARPAASDPSAACLAPLPDPSVALPAGHGLAFALDATGVQIYTCAQGASGPAWTFTAPEAQLLDAPGRPAGTHFAGPTWRALDGSAVAGARVAGATPDPTAIPWLLLRATSHSGNGRMGDVTFVQRVATRGGVAPVGGCDAGHLGATARVPYDAVYCFAVAR